MDWPFETLIHLPQPKKVCGVAEIVGDSKGEWDIGHVYVRNHHGFRFADHIERREVCLTLYTLAGGNIGRAYRKSLREPRYEQC